MSKESLHSPTLKNTVTRLIREAMPGVVLAGVYSVWDWMSSSPRPPLSQLVGKFSAAFFFVSWIIGQFIRVSKQLRVEYHLDDIRYTVNHIKETLDNANKASSAESSQAAAVSAPMELPSASAAAEPMKSTVPVPMDSPSVATPPASVGPSSTAPTTVSAKSSATRILGPSARAAETAGRALITEAEAAAQAGAYRASLMVAGAALEEAVREFGRSRGIAVSNTEPLTRIFSAARPLLGERLTTDLMRLWAIRNKVVHGQLDEKHAASLAPEILEALRKAVTILLDGTKHEKYTGIPCPRCGYPAIGSGGAQNVCGNCGFVECD